MLQSAESKQNFTKKMWCLEKIWCLTQTPHFFFNLTYIKILLENTSVTACQTPRNCFPTPRNNFCSVSAKIQIPPLRSEMFAIIRDVISQWLLRISQCMNICSKWVFEKSSQQKNYTTVVTHFKCSQHPNTTKKKMKSFPLFNIMMQTQKLNWIFDCFKVKFNH